MKVSKWLVTVATAVMLSFAGWVALTVIDLQARTSVVEAQGKDIRDWLERVERKLDRALGR